MKKIYRRYLLLLCLFIIILWILDKCPSEVRLTQALLTPQVRCADNEEDKHVVIWDRRHLVDKIKQFDDATLQDLGLQRVKGVKEQHEVDAHDVTDSLEQQLAFREVERVSTELWWYMRGQLNRAKQENLSARNNDLIDEILLDAYKIHRKLRGDLNKLSDALDGKTGWKIQEAKHLGDLVQRRLVYLQNPKDCLHARKLVCDLQTECGFGCQLHHVTFCLLVAYATHRTLILHSANWQYAPGGWETVFEPLSLNCMSTFGENAGHWNQETEKIIRLSIVSEMAERPSYLPLAVPEDLANGISRFHGNPSVWWIGQFVTYLTRPNKSFQNETKQMISELAFQKPIVGVHVRRTDKVPAEAAFHSVEEYMLHVQEWYDTYEYRNPGVLRRIFLATDDLTVFNEMKNKYPNYVIISNLEATASANSMRYDEKSLKEAILDMQLLSMCDFIVCTFSSNLCRAAYELMQPQHGDASGLFRSLDDLYYFQGQNTHLVQAVEDHVAYDQNELSFKKGQLIEILGNHWNGYSKGRNTDTGQEGFFLSYKVIDKIKVVPMTNYSELLIT